MKCNISGVHHEGTLEECCNYIKENEMTADVLRGKHGIKHYVLGVEIHPKNYEDYLRKRATIYEKSGKRDE